MSKKPSGRPIESIRWTVNLAASEFSFDRRTITARLREANEHPGVDGKFSTAQLVRALYGGSVADSQKRLNAARTQKLEIEAAILRRDHVPFDQFHECFLHMIKSFRGIVRGAFGKTVDDALGERIFEQINYAIDNFRKLGPENYEEETASKKKADQRSRSKGLHQTHSGNLGQVLRAVEPRE